MSLRVLKRFDLTVPLLHFLWEWVPALCTSAASAAVTWWAFERMHWAYALTMCLLVSLTAWHLALSVLKGLTAAWPHIHLDDHLLRQDIQALSDVALLREEQLHLLARSQHTPRTGDDRCPVCGTRSPSRCRPHLAAARYLYACQTERRVREDRAAQGIQPRSEMDC